MLGWLPLVFYAAAAAAYIAHFGKRDPRVGRVASSLLAGAVLAHTFVIGMQAVEAGYAPLVGTTAAISAFVWLLGLAYLYVELTTDERAMGAFVTVLLAALALLPALHASDVEPRPELLRSPLFTIHVLSMLFAYASFALAFVLGVTYVLLFNEIKAKHLGFFYARLPSLQVLDVMNGRAIIVGWIFLTCGLLVGGIWATQIHASPDPRAQAMSVADPKILVALLCWAMYSFALFARRAVAREIVVLSTCNRAEIYGVADTDTAADAFGRFISEYHQVAHETLQPHLFVHRGAEAATHLFRVAAGLDSLVVGEPQILGQVKDAFATASTLKHTGALTNRLFNSAFTVGKRVRSETGLGEGAVSVSYAAISLAKKIFGDLTGLDVLILGAGEMAELTGVHLRAQHVKQLTIASRTLPSAQALARA